VVLTLLRVLVTLHLFQRLERSLALEALHQAQEELPLKVVLPKTLLLAALLAVRQVMVARLLVKS
jgi:hypothetical protein